MVLAHLAGIKVFGTGGLGGYTRCYGLRRLTDLGGVHRGGESSMDISGTQSHFPCDF